MTLNIKDTFNLTGSNILSDDFIQNNDDILLLEKDIDLLIYIPSYMNWCYQNKEKDGNLICDFTINALAEHGRAKDNTSLLNFKYLCNNTQKELVYHFLLWCQNTFKFCNKTQIKRSLKHWE